MAGLFDLGRGLGSPVKRATFFSFHYADIMRVNVVRKSGEFATAVSDSGRHIEGYFDKSLWEKKKLESEEALRSMIREGVKRTSVVCVLVGSKTWQRPWVRYEIARSVVDGKGLVAIHINSIKHHQPPYASDTRGDNPCRYLGIARRSSNGEYYLVERVSVNDEYKWDWYKKYTHPIDIPKYMKPPEQNEPIRLSQVTREYDWSQNGYKNVGEWLDMAAQDAGR